MSFRELRNFTEIMRALGYPRLISVENFRTPNFALVADALYWMVIRYDPSINISDDIDSEQDRVDFLTSIAQIMLTKARIKLNTRRLYAADGHAVKELLKVANMLNSALKSNSLPQTDDDSSAFAATAKLHDLKTTRALGSDITQSGARLYDLLGRELQLREQRGKAIRFLDSISNNLHSDSEQAFIQRSLRALVDEVNGNVEALGKQCAELAGDRRSLATKIKKKKADLERKEKRLRSLQSVRPAFMDEYEKLERELEQQYEVYLERFRNLDFLEHELDLYNKHEREKMEVNERAMKRMQKKLRDEEMRILRGEQGLDGDAFDDAMRKEEFDQRPIAAAAGGRRQGRGGGDHRGGGRDRVIGNMDDDDDTESDLSDSDASRLSDDSDQLSLGASGSLSPSGSRTGSDDGGGVSDSDASVLSSDRDDLGGSYDNLSSDGEF